MPPDSRLHDWIHDWFPWLADLNDHGTKVKPGCASGPDRRLQEAPGAVQGGARRAGGAHVSGEHVATEKDCMSLSSPAPEERWGEEIPTTLIHLSPRPWCLRCMPGNLSGGAMR